MINRLLTITLMISVLLFGSVEVWSSSVIQLLVFTLGVIWVLRGEYRKYEFPFTVRLLFITFFIFIVYGLLQSVPLPSAVLKCISPVSFRMQSFYSVDARSAMTISLNTYANRYETIKAFAFLTVLAVCSTGFRDRDRLNKTMKTLTIFGFCLAIFAIIQKATWNNGIYWFRELTFGGSPFGPFVNRNHFAGLMGMLIPLGLGLSITRQTKEKMIRFGFMTVIMAVSLFLSLSRGGITSFFAGMALFALLMFQRNTKSQKVWTIGIFITIVIAYVIYLGIDPLIERFHKTDVTNEDRLAVWSATLAAISDFWLTGSGLGTFINIFPLYSQMPFTSIYDHAHNDYLEFFLETGLIGAALLLTFTALIIYNVIKFPLQGRKAVLRAAALSSAFTMMIHSIFDFNLHILSNLLIFALVLGMVIALACKNVHEDSSTSREQVAGKEKNADAPMAATSKETAPVAENPLRRRKTPVGKITLCWTGSQQANRRCRKQEQ